MFNTLHIAYMVISAVVTAVILLLAGKWLKKQGQKDCFLKFFAVATVLIHYSDIWVDFFTSGGYVYVSSVHILPMYPCNVVMWMLLAAALIPKKQSLPFQMLGEFCFFIGTVCSILGIVFNFNFDNNPTFADYSVLRGLLSHSTMLVGCLYMLVGRYIRIRPFNAVSVAAGFCVFVLCGLGVNGLYDYFHMDSPDGMFLRHNPYFPCSPILPGIALVIIMYLLLTLLQRHKNRKK